MGTEPRPVNPRSGNTRIETDDDGEWRLEHDAEVKGYWWTLEAPVVLRNNRLVFDSLTIRPKLMVPPQPDPPNGADSAVLRAFRLAELRADVQRKVQRERPARLAQWIAEGRDETGELSERLVRAQEHGDAIEGQPWKGGRPSKGDDFYRDFAIEYIKTNRSRAHLEADPPRSLHGYLCDQPRPGKPYGVSAATIGRWVKEAERLEYLSERKHGGDRKNARDPGLRLADWIEPSIEGDEE